MCSVLKSFSRGILCKTLSIIFIPLQPKLGGDSVVLLIDWSIYQALQICDADYFYTYHYIFIKLQTNDQNHD